MRRAPVTVPIALAGLSLLPVSAQAAAQVRVFNAAPAAGRATVALDVGPRPTTLRVPSYAKASARVRSASGLGTWRVRVGGRTVASGQADLDPGRRYTIMVLPGGPGLRASILRDATMAPRDEARIRVMHAAPELGSPDIATAGQTLARRLTYGRPTPYAVVAPGKQATWATRSGTFQAILSQQLRLPRGSAQTIVVVGTLGKPVRAITLTDVARGGGRASAATAGGATAGDYEVASGDTLWSIAAARLGGRASGDAIGAEAARLWSVNASASGLADPNVLTTGQALRLR